MSPSEHEGQHHIQSPEGTNFDELSLKYHGAMIKLHDRVQTLNGKPSKGGATILPILALFISLVSLGVAAFNANVNRLTMKGKILDTIDALSKLTPPPQVLGKPSSPSPSTGSLLSSDSNAYWLKIDELASNIDPTVKGSISERSYVTLISANLAFGDSKHAKVFLQDAESSGDKDSSTDIQLALEWAQLADATKSIEDADMAIAHISKNAKLSEPNNVINYQIHYDLADMYLLKSTDTNKALADGEFEAAQQALNAVIADDPVAAQRLSALQVDLRTRIDKRFPATPAIVKPK